MTTTYPDSAPVLLTCPAMAFWANHCRSESTVVTTSCPGTASVPISSPQGMGLPSRACSYWISPGVPASWVLSADSSPPEGAWSRLIAPVTGAAAMPEG